MNLPNDSVQEKLWALKVQYDCGQHKSKTTYELQPTTTDSQLAPGNDQRAAGDEHMHIVVD